MLIGTRAFDKSGIHFMGIQWTTAHHDMLQWIFSDNKKRQAQDVTSPVRGVYPVLSPEVLLEPHKSHLSQIEDLCGVSPKYFATYYNKAITNFARFVQQLPASEVHHHAGPGGMLTHTIEVMAHALKLRQARLLPIGADAETIAISKDLWTYAVFAGALCHDLAKPAVDQRVTMVDAHGSQLAEWAPWSHYLDEQGEWYRIEFNEKRRYPLHQTASLALVHRILPGEGIHWLSQDLDVLSAWFACIAGNLDKSGVLGEIVEQADRHSVALNLRADCATLPNVKTKPLHEKLLTSLRYLLRENVLPLNRNGAAGWVKNGYCWLVSKRVMDAVREHLLEEGHSGIPTQNGRLFDALQERGILETTGDRAIWRATIRGDNWENELTVLKIRADRLWPNSDKIPADFSGEVIVGKPTVEDGTGSHTDSKPDSSTVTTSAPLGLEQNATAEVSESREQSSKSSHKHKKAASKSNQSTVTTPHSQAETFLLWLRNGIAQGAIVTNNPNAPVHSVKEGVLLVTPAIFMAYSQAHSETDWIGIQKALLKRNWHTKAPDGLNVVKYTARGKNRESTLSGILVKDTLKIFKGSKIPQPNPHLFPKGNEQTDRKNA